MRSPVNYIGITNPFKKGKHNGVDFGWNSNYGGKNQPIYAVDDGEVIYKQVQTNSGGKVIHIKHNNGFVSEYGHLDSWCVNKGAKVKKGQKIGEMGCTGIAAGNHLHFGLYKGTSINYSKNNFVDPLKYICVYDNQVVGGNTQKKYTLFDTKCIKGVPSEPLMMHNAKNYKKSTECGKLYNGDEVEYFGSSLGFAILDNVRGRYCSNKYVK